MAFDDPLTERESDPRSVVLLATVESIEGVEDPLVFVGVDTDPLVVDAD